ncbi:hypothetical protein CSIRO_0088 [Bradyrhizobiaceae bacterium SG-6C]|nr:hypothetical protein CSIRO_0088 [Bradyrhizobiaceae bacterium SG-6C]
MLKLANGSAQDRVSNGQQLGGLPNTPTICGCDRKPELLQVNGVRSGHAS